MPRVAISGYIVGFRFRENKENTRYGVVDLLQFGSQQSDSEIVPLLVYDKDLQITLNQRFLVGQIRPASFTCNIIQRDKSWMWVADKLVDIQKDVSKPDAFTQPEVVVNDTGSVAEDKELTTGSIPQ